MCGVFEGGVNDGLEGPGRTGVAAPNQMPVGDVFYFRNSRNVLEFFPQGFGFRKIF
jgi:hypothetical protein